MGGQARREADSVARATVRPSNGAWASLWTMSRCELSSEFLTQHTSKQTARQAAAHPGFDDMAPSAVLLALRICDSYSTRLAPCIQGHLVRNAAHEGFCISLLDPGAANGTAAVTSRHWRTFASRVRSNPPMPCFGSLRCTSRASATAESLTLPSTVGEERAIAPLLRATSSRSSDTRPTHLSTAPWSLSRSEPRRTRVEGTCDRLPA